jgi:hypothetical protein
MCRYFSTPWLYWVHNSARNQKASMALRSLWSRLCAWFRLESRWNRLRLFGNSTVARATIAVPVLGYFLLFNERVLGYLRLHTAFCAGVGCEVSWRLYFIYFGCCWVAVGSALYWWLCPLLIKKYSGGPEFFEAEKAYHSQPGNLKYLFDEIEKVKGEPASDPNHLMTAIINNKSGLKPEDINMLADPMREHYCLQNRMQRPLVR